MLAGALSLAPAWAGPNDPATKKFVRQKVKKVRMLAKKLAADRYTKAEADAEFLPRLFAVVGDDGTLVRGAGAVSAEVAAMAHYDVIFNRDVTGCAYVAVLGSVGSTLGPSGEAVVAQDPTNPNGVRVKTADSAGVLDPESFHLHVAC